MKFELIDELKYENIDEFELRDELKYENYAGLSDCCDALPHTEVYDGIGLCSKCKEWAEFGGFMAQDSKWSKVDCGGCGEVVLKQR